MCEFPDVPEQPPVAGNQGPRLSFSVCSFICMCFELEPHVAQAGLKLSIQLKIILKDGF